MSDLIDRHEAIRTITSYNGTVDKSVAKRLFLQMPSAEPEQSIAEWKKDFREYINMLNIPRDDYNGIMEYINDLPSASTDLSNNSPKIDNENGELISRQAAIYVEGLDEEIRCEMCRNPMRTNRGCDGNCKYDEKLYERIMQILGERIKQLPSAQPEIIRCKDCRHGVDYYHEGDCYCLNPKYGMMYFGGSWEFYCADAERGNAE